RVFYQGGMNATGGKGTNILVERVLPYFKRTDVKFSSHFQTPPVSKADKFSAVISGDRFIYFADPIFREYRQAGNLAARDAWKRAMEQLTGVPPFGAGLPGTILVVPRRRNDDLILTLLHYIPVRKSLDVDIIEDRSSFAGELLHLPPEVKEVRISGTNELLLKKGKGIFALPAAKGRLLLEVRNFFCSSHSPKTKRKTLKTKTKK
ncbi:MAG: hypothetical protein WCD79_01300, partial [Chthoniobacteraceae bacterium]